MYGYLTYTTPPQKKSYPFNFHQLSPAVVAVGVDNFATTDCYISYFPLDFGPGGNLQC